VAYAALKGIMASPGARHRYHHPGSARHHRRQNGVHKRYNAVHVDFHDAPSAVHAFLVLERLETCHARAIEQDVYRPELLHNFRNHSRCQSQVRNIRGDGYGAHALTLLNLGHCTVNVGLTARNASDACADSSKGQSKGTIDSTVGIKDENYFVGEGDGEARGGDERIDVVAVRDCGFGEVHGHSWFDLNGTLVIEICK